MGGRTGVWARGGVSAPKPPLSRGGLLLRIGVLVLLWLLWVVLAVAYLELSGVAGDFSGWRWAAVAFTPLAVPTWLLSRRCLDDG